MRPDFWQVENEPERTCAHLSTVRSLFSYGPYLLGVPFFFLVFSNILHLLEFRWPELVKASTLTLGQLVVLVLLVLMLIDRAWRRLWQLSFIQLALGLTLYYQGVELRYKGGTCAKSGLCDLATALEMYRVDRGAYPPIVSQEVV
ncbi:MAG: hypothetical protein AMXMBFR33_70320 [Candidatus Xenobia bacterium]